MVAWASVDGLVCHPLHLQEEDLAAPIHTVCVLGLTFMMHQLH